MDLKSPAASRPHYTVNVLYIYVKQRLLGESSCPRDWQGCYVHDTEIAVFCQRGKLLQFFIEDGIIWITKPLNSDKALWQKWQSNGRVTAQEEKQGIGMFTDMLAPLIKLELNPQPVVWTSWPDLTATANQSVQETE